MVKCVDVDKVETPHCGDVNPQYGGFTRPHLHILYTSAPQFQSVDVWTYIMDLPLKGIKPYKFAV